MIRRSQLLALGTVGLLSLVGCSTPDQANKPAVVDSSQQAATDAAGAAKNSAAAAKDSAAAAKDAAGAASMAPTTGGAAELMTVVTNTKTAVEASDFAKAKEEFTKFEGSWSKVEDGVKTASSKGYTAIETNVDGVNTALGAAQPDKAKVMAALTALSASISSFVKP